MGVSALELKKEVGNRPEVPDVDRTKVKSFYHPMVLGVTIPILVRSQGMSNTLNRVNDRAGEIIGRINLPLLAIAYCELWRVKRERGNSYPVR